MKIITPRDQDGVDLRGLPLTERERDLRRLCAKARVPFMSQVQTCCSIIATSSASKVS